MTVDKALTQLGVKDFEIEHWAAGTVDGMNADIIVASPDFEEEFSRKDNVVYIKNIVSNNEAKEKMAEYLTRKGLL
jgi:galactitol-specific phosphotransferase system IIB component